SSTWLTPTVTNSVLLGLWCRFPSNSSSKRPAIPRDSGRAYRAAIIRCYDMNGEFESWWQQTLAPSPCSAEPVFSADASSGICALADFRFGSRQGIRIGGGHCLVLMIHSFNRYAPTFTMRGQSRMRLPAPMAL